jgi:hypothetical protein
MKRTANAKKAREDKINHMMTAELEIAKYKPLL